MSFFLKKLWRKITRSDQARAYIKTFETQDGMLVLHDLASRYHLLTHHDGGERAEGERTVVLHILHLCNFTEEDFAILAQSENERQGDDP